VVWTVSEGVFDMRRPEILRVVSGFLQTGAALSAYPVGVVPRTGDTAQTSRLKRLKNLVDDLARAQSGDPDLSRAMADVIKGEIDLVLRALARGKPAT
jgi:hypothetical protein